MAEELFEIEESLSPYVAFCRRHGVEVDHDPGRGASIPYCAYLAGELDEVLSGTLCPDTLGWGEDERSAVFDLAVKRRLEGFNFFDWGL